MTVIEAQSASKRFLLHHNASAELKVRFLGLLSPGRRQSAEEFWALRDVSLKISAGESVGLIGRNGSGKSTFLKLVAGTHRTTSGRLLIARGARIASMIELGVGFHPELTGRENIFLNAAIHGLTKDAIDGIYQKIVDYSGLSHFIDVPIKNYSSGMSVRLGFAVAANLDPDILLLDEIFAVGDADFQRRCMDTVKSFKDRGKTLLFVSHAPSAIQAICHRVCLLEQGELTFDGSPEEGLAFYSRLSASGTSNGREPEKVVAKDDVVEPVAATRDERERGMWLFDFLRKRGLEKDHYVLDVGCRRLDVGVHLLAYLTPGHYVGVDSDPLLLDAGLTIELPRAGIDPERGYYVIGEGLDLGSIHARSFDVVVSNSLFARLPFNGVAHCIANVATKLKPTGRFYSTWFENPIARSFEPIRRASGLTTYADREPYHYPFEMIADFCTAIGVRAERVHDDSMPDGQSVLVISPVNPGIS